jgi:hypothetical protein
MGILDRIDAALDGLCPCGATPQPGSAYCGDDCTPTHRADDTTSDTDGTAMRWRPDLVTGADDTGLTLIGTPQRIGRYTARVFRRDGTNQVHLRLDDGHRWVGVDIDRVSEADYEDLCEQKWHALMRQLTNVRLADPNTDPWGDVRWTDIGATEAASGTSTLPPALQRVNRTFRVPATPPFTFEMNTCPGPVYVRDRNTVTFCLRAIAL